MPSITKRKLSALGMRMSVLDPEGRFELHLAYDAGQLGGLVLEPDTVMDMVDPSPSSIATSIGTLQRQKTFGPGFSNLQSMARG